MGQLKRNSKKWRLNKDNIDWKWEKLNLCRKFKANKSDFMIVVISKSFKSLFRIISFRN